MAQERAGRTIERVWTVEPSPQGPNHLVGMVLQPGRWTEYDPFLMLAEDWFERGVFDVHPHRGQETVTYVIEGNLEHYDNKAGGGELGPGDVQWMTAGRGVIHKEDPAVGQRVHSLQLWLNLPRVQKMTEPRYQNLRGKDMPVREEPGVLIRVFSGSSGNVVSNTQNHVPVTMVELNLEPGATVVQDLPEDYNGFIYVLEGSGTFGANDTEGRKSQVLWLGGAGAENRGAGNGSTSGEAGSGFGNAVGSGSSSSAGREPSSEVKIHANEKLKALLYAGRPLNEPVVQYGPFVMSTKAEIAQAIEDYQQGRFGE